MITDDRLREILIRDMEACINYYHRFTISFAQVISFFPPRGLGDSAYEALNEELLGLLATVIQEIGKRDL